MGPLPLSCRNWDNKHRSDELCLPGAAARKRAAIRELVDHVLYRADTKFPDAFTWALGVIAQRTEMAKLWYTHILPAIIFGPIRRRACASSHNYPCAKPSTATRLRSLLTKIAVATAEGRVKKIYTTPSWRPQDFSLQRPHPAPQ